MASTARVPRVNPIITDTAAESAMGWNWALIPQFPGVGPSIGYYIFSRVCSRLRRVSVSFLVKWTQDSSPLLILFHVKKAVYFLRRRQYFIVSESPPDAGSVASGSPSHTRGVAVPGTSHEN